MSVSDTLMLDYFEYLTDVPDKELDEMRRAVESESVNPMNLKSSWPPTSPASSTPNPTSQTPATTSSAPSNAANSPRTSPKSASASPLLLYPSTLLIHLTRLGR